jgi:hypothetical protein
MKYQCRILHRTTIHKKIISRRLDRVKLIGLIYPVIDNLLFSQYFQHLFALNPIG